MRARSSDERDRSARRLIPRARKSRRWSAARHPDQEPPGAPPARFRPRNRPLSGGWRSHPTGPVRRDAPAHRWSPMRRRSGRRRVRPGRRAGGRWPGDRAPGVRTAIRRNVDDRLGDLEVDDLDGCLTFPGGRAERHRMPFRPISAADIDGSGLRATRRSWRLATRYPIVVKASPRTIAAARAAPHTSPPRTPLSPRPIPTGSTTSVYWNSLDKPDRRPRSRLTIAFDRPSW